MNIFLSFSSLSEGILFTSVILNVFLGYIVLRSNIKSATNRLFALLTVSISVWMAVFFVSIQPVPPGMTSLQWIRWSLFFTVPVNVLFLLLAYTFPDDKLAVKRSTFWTLLFLTIAVCAITISPFAFTKVSLVNNFPMPESGKGLVFFAVFVLLTNIATLHEMIIRYRTSIGELKTQIGFFLLGTVLFLILMFGTVLVPILAFQNVSTVPFAPLYTLIFIATTTYASFRHHLFNVKVIATQAFVTVLCVVFFARTFTAVSAADRLVDSIIFLATLGFGVLLVRSVKEEVRTREKIQDLAKRLTDSNWELARTNEQLRIIDQRKSEFVSIVSHQLRTPITAMKGYASLLLDGSYGALSGEQKPPVEKIFISSNRLATMVTEFLDISKIEQGTMTYTFSSVDVRTMVAELREEFVKKAEAKGLALEFIDPGEGSFVVSADDGKIRQCFSNLIDNSIKYTPTGSIRISLEKDEVKSTIICRIKDTGIGLSQEDIHHLFAKFARGTEGQRHNTEGSGIGLYVAKKMIEAQHGTIWIDSEGPGKGSTFVIELSTKPETKAAPEEK